MADGSIKIAITGDADPLEEELEHVKDEAEKTGDDLDKSGDNGAQFGDKIVAGLKRAAKFMIAGAVAKAAKDLVSDIIQVGSEFETSMAKVSTIADAGSAGLGKVSADILQLSSDTGAAASDIAEVAYNAISAGVDTANAVAVAGDATKLATAGFTNADSALSVLTTTMNSYADITEEDFGAVSDSLITVQNLGVTTIDQLAGSMGRAISTASAYGVDLYNLEAGYIALTKAGISTEESTTYMSSMFSELGDAGSEVAEILRKETGQSFGELMESGQSLGDVLGILNDSVDGNSEALMNLWGSQEAGKAANAIINQGLDTFNENLNSVQESAGAADEAYEKMADTFTYQSQLIAANLDNLKIRMSQTFGEGLKDSAAQIATGLQELNTAFAEGGISGFINQIPTFVGQMATMGTQLIAGLLTGIGQSLPTLIPAAFQTVANFVMGLAQGIPNVAAGAITLLEGLAQGLINAVPVILQAIPQIILSILSGIAGAAPTLIQGGLYIVGQLAVGIIQAIPDIIAALPSILAAIVGGIGNMAGSLAASFVGLFTGGMDAGAESALSAATASGAEVANAAVDGVTSASTVPASDAGMALATDYASAIEAEATNATAAAETLASATSAGLSVTDAASTMAAGTQLATDYASGLSAASGTVSTAAETLMSAASSGATADSGAMQSAGTEAGQAFSSGFTSSASTVDAAAKSVSQQTAKTLQSTKSDYIKVGQALMQALIIGIKQRTSQMRTGAKTVAIAGYQAVRSTYAQWYAAGGYLAAGIARGITQNSGMIKSAAVRAVEAARVAAENSQGVGSPSTVWRDKLGQWLPAGAAEGIRENAGTMVKAADWLMDQAIHTASARLSQLRVSAAQSLSERSNRDGRAISNSYTTNQYSKNQMQTNGTKNYTYSPTFQSPKALDRKELNRQAKRDARRLKQYV